MVRDSKVCQECVQNCLLTHQKQKSASPVVTCFFKIMLGEDYLKLLYLPPSFSRKVRDMIGQPTYLEDSIGQRWPVMISILDSYVAIQEGWHKFALDHLLEVGDFLTFFYVQSSHFVVQIYGKSGCERLNFNRRRDRPRKRSREEEEELAVLDEPIPSLNINSGDKPRSGLNFKRRRGRPRKRSREEEEEEEEEIVVLDEPIPSLNINSLDKPRSRLNFNRRRGRPRKRYREEEDEEILFLDEPIPSLNINSVDKPGSRLNFNRRRGRPRKRSSEEEEEEILVLDEPIPSLKINLGDKPGSGTPVFSESEFEHGQNFPKQPTASNSGINFGKRQIFPTTTSADESVLMLNTNPGYNPSVLSTYPTEERNNAVLGNARVFSPVNETLSLGSSKITGTNYTAMPKHYGCSVSVPTVKVSSGGQTLRVKEEPVKMGEVAFGLHKKSSGKEPNTGIKCAPMPFQAVRNIKSIVKTEPDMQSTLVPCVAASPILVLVRCQSYLELPTSLPAIEGRNEGGNSQLIYLRDSVGRLWPVLFTETLNFTALVDGWQRFCQKKDIQPGDFCKFKCENSVQFIYGIECRRISKSVG